MRKNIKVISLVLTILIFQNGCVVWDIAKGIVLEGEKLLKKIDWEKYLKKVEDVLELKENIMLAFEVNKARMKPSVRALFKDNIILTELEENIATRDPEKKDPWHEIWQGENTLNEKFPEYENDYSKIRKSRIYKEDKYRREFVDRVIEIEEENRKDFDGLIEFIVETHKIDNGEEILEGTGIYEGGGIEKMKNFQDQLLKFSKNGKEGKMKALLGFVENEILKIEMIINSMKRVKEEYFLKLSLRKNVLEKKAYEITEKLENEE